MWFCVSYLHRSKQQIVLMHRTVEYGVFVGKKWQMTNISFEIANLTFFFIFEIKKSNFLVPSPKTRRWF